MICSESQGQVASRNTAISHICLKRKLMILLALDLIALSFQSPYPAPYRLLHSDQKGAMPLLRSCVFFSRSHGCWVQCKAGALVVLHGANVHFSHENTSPQSRHAYSMHVVEGTSATHWAADNWCAPNTLPSVDIMVWLHESVPSHRMLGTLWRVGASPCCS